MSKRASIEVVPCPNCIEEALRYVVRWGNSYVEIGMPAQGHWCGTEAEAQAKAAELRCAERIKSGEIPEAVEGIAASLPTQTRPPRFPSDEEFCRKTCGIERALCQCKKGHIGGCNPNLPVAAEFAKPLYLDALPRAAAPVEPPPSDAPEGFWEYLEKNSAEVAKWPGWMGGKPATELVEQAPRPGLATDHLNSCTAESPCPLHPKGYAAASSPAARPQPTPPFPDLDAIPYGHWFFHDSPDCVSRYSVQERTGSGCSIVCSTPYTHEWAKTKMQRIVELYNASLPAAPIAVVEPRREKLSSGEVLRIVEKLFKECGYPDLTKYTPDNMIIFGCRVYELAEAQRTEGAE